MVQMSLAPLSPSRMKHRVQVQQLIAVPTGNLNETKNTWATVNTRWADIISMDAYEAEYGPQVQSNASHVVRMRYYAGLTSQHRLAFQGRGFAIEGVFNVDEASWESRCFVLEVPGET